MKIKIKWKSQNICCIQKTLLVCCFFDFLVDKGVEGPLFHKIPVTFECVTTQKLVQATYSGWPVGGF